MVLKSMHRLIKITLRLPTLGLLQVRLDWIGRPRLA